MTKYTTAVTQLISRIESAERFLAAAKAQLLSGVDVDTVDYPLRESVREIVNAAYIQGAASALKPKKKG